MMSVFIILIEIDKDDSGNGALNMQITINVQQKNNNTFKLNLFEKQMISVRSH